MDKKKILLIGDANSIFIFNYAFWLKKIRPDYQIDIFATAPIKEENIKYFDNIIRIDQFPNFNRINRIKGIRRILLLSLYNELLKNLPDYDYFHIHFVSPLRYSLIRMLKNRKKGKIVLSIWGSDLYRLNPIDKISFKKVCNLADLISMANPQTINYFKSTFNWKKNNLLECRFGLHPLELIEKTINSSVECKQLLNLDANKITITIGYNLSTAQQHIKIIKQFESEELLSLKDKIQLVLPLSYGGTTEGKNKIISKLNDLPYEYHIFDSYMTDNEIVYLRKASDIMIQVQLTDQFSGSMQEHLFAGSVVITGSWLPYQQIKEKGIQFVEIEEISQLKTILPTIIENFESYKSKTDKNKVIISELSSWGNNIEYWAQLYQ